jgi:tetratricopeptide (TPR) repeat protein
LQKISLLEGLPVAKQNQAKRKAENKKDTSRAKALQQAAGFEWARDFGQAECIYLELIRKNDRDPVANLQLAQLYRNVGQAARALPLLRKLDQLESYDAPLCNSIGVLWQLSGQPQEGVAALERAVKLMPGSMEFRFNLGFVLLNAALPLRAEECFAKCLEADPKHVPSLQQLGLALRASSRPKEALEIFQRAVALEPGNIQLRVYLALTYVNLSLIDQAVDCWKRILEIDPANSLAHLRLSHLRKSDHDIAGMEGFYAKAVNPADRINLAFGLGKALEDVGSHAQAFRYLLEGNQLKRKEFRYSSTEIRTAFQGIESIFTAEFVRSFPDAGVLDDTPIFILGMPRSGSSLVEQILSSHPDVFGAGELKALAALCTEGVARSPLPFPDHFRRLEESDWRKMGEQYLSILRSKNSVAKRITDKMPQNFRYVGAISIILPRARIIHCQRSPFDNCWSLYKNLFGEGHPYTYDLEELGKFYSDYHRLMRHWNTVLPGRIHNIHYEKLVSSPQTEIPALLEFCGLSFDQRCIDFHENERVVDTMSAAQVKRPINTESVERWLPFKPHLAPLVQTLLLD